MNGKFLIQTILAACLIVASMTDVYAVTKIHKKQMLRCHQKKHLFFTSCPGSNPTDMISHGGNTGGGKSRTVSDIRLKHNLKLVGVTVFDLPLYDFEYNGQHGTYEGVMAQDVLKVKPLAVSIGADGYYRVNYQMLGLKLKHIE
jgi:hypothetical protein